MHAAPSLTAWFSRTARPLPWRNGYDPYRVWVSEVMLQQTQVDTVLPYYDRFLERFPALADLASANLEDVLHLWSGLGYYSRARNLKKAAERIVAEHGGKLPSEHAALLALPGIGRYMAGAIMSIAFNEPCPIVDGNVRRVISRLNGWENPSDKQLWSEAERMVGAGEPRAVNQAMMELGATVCTFRNPQCGACPCENLCAARTTGSPESFPVPRKRAKTIRVDLVAIIDENDDGVVMREKGSLWEFPTVESPPRNATKTGHCRHTITHHRIEVDVYRGKAPADPSNRRVVFDEVPVTALTRKIREAGNSLVVSSN